MHAALGDPARLAVVDALALADLAPGELSQRLGLGSNLLSHHLKILEDVGLVRRRRSEGDGRRSYVSLTGRALGLPMSAQEISAPRVVFVCSRNSARSQLAAALWTGRTAVPAASAGTRPAERMHPRAMAAADRHGIALGATTPRHVSAVVHPDDLVVAVCDQAHEELALPRLHWSVPDPVRIETDDAFDRAVTDLDDRIVRLADRFSAVAP